MPAEYPRGHAGFTPVKIIHNGELVSNSNPLPVTGGGASIGGAVTSGTTGSILFVNPSATLAQDNANLFWDDTNNRLGIGTNAPTASLDVLNSVSAVSMRLKGVSQATFELNDGTASYVVGIAGFIRLAPSATTMLTVKNTGAGVGTETMSARFNVLSTTEQLRVNYDASNYFSTTVSSANAVSFRPAVDSTTGYQWQNAAGTGVLTVDTTNQQLSMNIGANTVGFFKGGSNITPNFVIGASGGKAVGLLAGTGGTAFQYDNTGSFNIATEARATMVAGSSSGGTNRVQMTSAGLLAVLGSSGASNSSPVDYLQIGDPASVNQSFGASELRVRFGTSTRVTASQNNGQSSGGVAMGDGTNYANYGANTALATINGKAGDVKGLLVGAPNTTVWSALSPVQYSVGTASQTGTTVTGSGTTWTSDMVGSIISWHVAGVSGAAARITAFGSTTSLTVDVSQSVGASAYRISYPGVQVKASGEVGIGTATQTAGWLNVRAGNTVTGPMNITAGVNKTTPVAGDVEFNGTNLFFTRVSTRENVLTGNDAAAAPATNTVGVIVDYYGTSATRVLTTPNSWASVVIGGTTYKIPLYS